jgi:hypothetical protein
MSQTTTRAAARGAWPVERFEMPKQWRGLLGPCSTATEDREVEEAFS